MSLGAARIRINPNDSEAVRALKGRFRDLIDAVDALPADGDGEIARRKALAVTAIEEASMWTAGAAVRMRQ